MSRAHSTITSAPPPPLNVLRCLAVWAAVTVAATIGTLLCADAVAQAWDTGAHASPDAAVLLVAAGAGLLACPWVWLVATSTVVDHLRGRGLRNTGVVRRLVLGACGVAVSLTALPAHAETDVPDTGRSASVLDGLPLPDRASSGPGRAPAAPEVTSRPVEPPTAPPLSQPTAEPVADDTDGTRDTDETGATDDTGDTDDNRVHEVRPGDSLWVIAAEHSHSSPGGADVATVAQALYEENLDVIGADPDLIHPGQELVLPDPEASR